MYDKRDQILKAGIKVVARNGLDKGKIADIAKVAGIGKGTVYEYFRSKEEIFTAIETTVFGDLAKSLELIKVSELSPTEKLRTIMNEGIDKIDQMEDALLILSELWAHTARGLWHKHGSTNIAAVYDYFHDTIKIILKDGINSGEFREMSKDGVATLLSAFMDGLALQYMLLKDKKCFAKVKKEAIRSFIKGIEK